MAKEKVHVFTKAELAKFKARDAKMTPAQKYEISKAMVKANSEANTPKKGKR